MGRPRRERRFTRELLQELWPNVKGRRTHDALAGIQEQEPFLLNALLEIVRVMAPTSASYLSKISKCSKVCKFSNVNRFNKVSKFSKVNNLVKQSNLVN